jgi:hypothetical protein
MRCGRNFGSCMIPASSWNRFELSQLIVSSFTNSYFGWNNITEVRQLATPVEYSQLPDGLCGVLYPTGLDVYILQVQSSSALMFIFCRCNVRLPWCIHPADTKFVCLDVYILPVQCSSALMFTSCRYKVRLPWCLHPAGSALFTSCRYDIRLPWCLHPAGTKFVCLDVYILQVQYSSALMFISCRYKVRMPWCLHPIGTKFVIFTKLIT